MSTIGVHEQNIAPAIARPIVLVCAEPERMVSTAGLLTGYGYSTAPAWFLFEWTEYTVLIAGATSLRVGSTVLPARVTGVFILRFENQLGFTTIQPLIGNVPLGAPVAVEVIARKFAHPTQSLQFMDALLQDLFAQHSPLPFLTAAATGRFVREARRPPNPLFFFHFFRQFGRELVRAVHTITHRPMRQLADEVEYVRIDQVRDVDLDTMFSILQGATSASTNRSEPNIVRRLRPERIRQLLPIETIDTPENRFVMNVARRFLGALDALTRVAWYDDRISEQDRRLFEFVRGELTTFVQDRQFQDVGQLERIPAASRVLQRQDGYREVTHLWFSFQRARQPLFDRLQHAIDIRDVATLYEYWVFFELAAQIGAAAGADGQLVAKPRTAFDSLQGIMHGTCYRYDGFGELFYNRRVQGYSGIALRPDYLWVPHEGRAVAFDAKFRMNYGVLETNDDDIAQTIYTAKEDDLVKMHAYRDAIDVRAAVILYPGSTSCFRHNDKTRIPITIADILKDESRTGVGEIAMSPMSPMMTETLP